MQLAGRVPFRCTAIKIGAAISATGKIDATNASLEIHTKDDAMVLFSGNDSVLLNDLDCLNSPGCKVSGVTEEVRNLTCPRGQGFRKRADGLACAACRPKHARLAAEAVCRPCPSLASLGKCKVRCQAPCTSLRGSTTPTINRPVVARYSKRFALYTPPTSTLWGSLHHGSCARDGYSSKRLL